MTERKPLWIVFDGPPEHDSGRFVEVEDESGASVRLSDGGWSHADGDRYWRLGPVYAAPPAAGSGTPGAYTVLSYSRWPQRLRIACDSLDWLDIGRTITVEAFGERVTSVAAGFDVRPRRPFDHIVPYGWYVVDLDLVGNEAQEVRAWLNDREQRVGQQPRLTGDGRLDEAEP